MMRDRRSLLEQIEDGALDSRQSLPDLLRKCVALGGMAGSGPLRDWARSELDGYSNGQELPSYRRVTAPLRIDGMNLRWHVTGQQISRHQLPEFARDAYLDTVDLPFGIAEIERSASAHSSIHLQASGMAEVVTYMNMQADYGSAVHSLYYSVEPTAFYGVLDTVRTNLVALVAEMRAAGVSGDDVPSAIVAEHAVQVVINGAKRSPIQINTSVAQDKSFASVQQSMFPRSESRVPSWLRGPWAVLVGGATIAAGYAGFAASLGWPPF